MTRSITGGDWEEELRFLKELEELVELEELEELEEWVK